ncbi:MAG: LysR family transcriptional regulator [Rhodomicrobium sp.]|nr:LysR family transcriptional regulator [Rhodomicrobium sp.]
MRLLNLDQLKALMAVAASGNFSEAARVLSLTQPAISQQIKELEQRLGVRLLERSGRHAQLTPAGKVLVDRARDLLDRADAAVAEMAHYRDGKLGQVRLGSDATFCAFLLPPIVRELLNAYPDLQLTVEAGPSSELIHKVAVNELDIALVTTPQVLERSLTSEPIISNEFMAFWPDTMGPAPDFVTPMDLNGRPFLNFKPGRVMHKLVQTWLDAEGSKPSPVMSFDIGVTIAAIVAAGLGATILPEEVQIFTNNFASVSMRPIEPRIPRQLISVMRRDKMRTPAIRVLQAALRDRSIITLQDTRTGSS